MPTLTIDRDKQNRISLSFQYNPDLMEAIKSIPSRKWDKLARVHYVGKYDLPIVMEVFSSFGYTITYTPAANILLRAFLSKQQYLVDIKNGVEPYAAETELKHPLRGFQETGKGYLACVKKGLLADDMGLGKTVQVLSTFKYAKEHGLAHKMMVLGPATVKGSWAKDIAKFTDIKFQVIDGDRKERERLYKNEYDVIIMSYDTYLADFGAKEKTDKQKAKDKLREPIPLPQVDFLALDEVQRLVRVKNKTTQSLLILKEKIKLEYIILMTGTPIINKVEDLWSLMYYINPELAGEFWQFRSRYCVLETEEIRILDRKVLAETGKYQKKLQKISHVVGYKNLEELKTKIDPYYIRREKKDVAKDLPEKTYETLEIELSKEQRMLYSSMKSEFLDFFSDNEINGANALTWFVRAKQICDSAEILDLSLKNSSKLNELKELLNDLIVNGNHKVVLFSQYKEMTDILVREFQDYKPLYLHGQTPDKDRPMLIDAFQEDPEYKLFICTLRAGGVGITLTAADTVILYDKWFSPAINNQAIDRVHRIGQTSPVTVIDFICRDTLEERVEEILKRKKAMFDGIFSDDPDALTQLTAEELKALI